MPCYKYATWCFSSDRVVLMNCRISMWYNCISIRGFRKMFYKLMMWLVYVLQIRHVIGHGGSGTQQYRVWFRFVITCQEIRWVTVCITLRGEHYWKQTHSSMMSEYLKLSKSARYEGVRKITYIWFYGSSRFSELRSYSCKADVSKLPFKLCNAKTKYPVCHFESWFNTHHDEHDEMSSCCIVLLIIYVFDMYIVVCNTTSFRKLLGILHGSCCYSQLYFQGHCEATRIWEIIPLVWSAQI